MIIVAWIELAFMHVNPKCYKKNKNKAKTKEIKAKRIPQREKRSFLEESPLLILCCIRIMIFGSLRKQCELLLYMNQIHSRCLFSSEWMSWNISVTYTHTRKHHYIHFSIATMNFCTFLHQTNTQNHIKRRSRINRKKKSKKYERKHRR